MNTRHKSCCISGCNKTIFHRNSEEIHFYNLKAVRNRDHERYLKWVKAANAGRTLADHEMVCSNHFTDEDYVASDVMKRRLLPPGSFKLGPRLLHTAVPHCNLSTQQENLHEKLQVSTNHLVSSRGVTEQQDRIANIKTEQEEQVHNGSLSTWTDIESVQEKIEPFEAVFISDFNYEMTLINGEPTEQPAYCLTTDIQPTAPDSRRELSKPLLHCDLCLFCTDDKSELATHIQIHYWTKTFKSKLLPKKTLRCEECGVRCTQPELLTWHQEFCHGANPLVRMVNMNDVPHYVCNFCECIFRGLRALTIHLHLNHQLSNLPFHCSVCDKPFIFVERLRKHQAHCTDAKITRAVPSTGIQCKMCGDCFECDEKLKEHVSNFHAVSESRYSCRYCDKKFICFDHLKSHCVVNHPGRKYLLCDLCNVGFISINGFSMHNIEKHWWTVSTMVEI